ncbi:hypothetical protein D9M72_621620 [compost metagenome]
MSIPLAEIITIGPPRRLSSFESSTVRVILATLYMSSYSRCLSRCSSGCRWYMPEASMAMGLFRYTGMSGIAFLLRSRDRCSISVSARPTANAAIMITPFFFATRVMISPSCSSGSRLECLRFP